MTYHMGAGKATVHLKLEFNWDMVTGLRCDRQDQRQRKAR